MKRLALLLLLLGFHAARADTFIVPITGESRITQFDESGAGSFFTTAFVNGPIGVALDAQGNLYVSTNANRIEKFSPTGVDLGTFATVGLNFPMGLAFDRAGNLYAANYAGNNVQKFTPAGVGSVFAGVIRPTGLAFDAAGNLYVANFGNTIEEFAPDGSFLGTFANSGLNNPEGLVFDSLGNLYVANNGSDTVEAFSPEGVDLGVVVRDLSGPVGLGFDRAGSLYIVNARDSTLRKVTADGSVTIFANTGFMPAFLAVQRSPTLVNLSARLDILTGENVLVSGFIITGTGTKQILIRGLGPSLGDAGVTGVLADPILELHDASGAIIAMNDDWKTTQQIAIAATGIPPTADAEAALLVTLAPGAYTIVQRGKNNGTGIGLVELYDLTSGFGPELANISTRGFVDTGSGVMIAGVILAAPTGGEGSVLVRALGPSLRAQGVVQPLADPTLELRDANGALLASNDDWRATQEAAIELTGVPPTNDLEAALVATLAPGQYTAIERGQNSGTGVGLIEVYNLH